MPRSVDTNLTPRRSSRIVAIKDEPQIKSSPNRGTRGSSVPLENVQKQELAKPKSRRSSLTSRRASITDEIEEEVKPIKTRRRSIQDEKELVDSPVRATRSRRSMSKDLPEEVDIKPVKEPERKLTRKRRGSVEESQDRNTPEKIQAESSVSKINNMSPQTPTRTKKPTLKFTKNLQAIHEIDSDEETGTDTNNSLNVSKPSLLKNTTPELKITLKRSLSPLKTNVTPKNKTKDTSKTPVEDATTSPNLNDSNASDASNKENSTAHSNVKISPDAKKRIVDKITTSNLPNIEQNVTVGRVSDAFRHKGIEYSFSEPMDVDTTISELNTSKLNESKLNKLTDKSIKDTLSLSVTLEQKDLNKNKDNLKKPEIIEEPSSSIGITTLKSDSEVALKENQQEVSSIENKQKTPSKRISSTVIDNSDIIKSPVLSVKSPLASTTLNTSSVDVLDTTKKDDILQENITVTNTISIKKASVTTEPTSPKIPTSKVTLKDRVSKLRKQQESTNIENEDTSPLKLTETSCTDTDNSGILNSPLANTTNIEEVDVLDARKDDDLKDKKMITDTEIIEETSQITECASPKISTTEITLEDNLISPLRKQPESTVIEKSPSQISSTDKNNSPDVTTVTSTEEFEKIPKTPPKVVDISKQNSENSLHNKSQTDIESAEKTKDSGKEQQTLKRVKEVKVTSVSESAKDLQKTDPKKTQNYDQNASVIFVSEEPLQKIEASLEKAIEDISTKEMDLKQNMSVIVVSESNKDLQKADTKKTQLKSDQNDSVIFVSEELSQTIKDSPAQEIKSELDDIKEEGSVKSLSEDYSFTIPSDDEIDEQSQKSKPTAEEDQVIDIEDIDEPVDNSEEQIDKDMEESFIDMVNDETIDTVESDTEKTKSANEIPESPEVEQLIENFEKSKKIIDSPSEVSFDFENSTISSDEEGQTKKLTKSSEQLTEPEDNKDKVLNTSPDKNNKNQLETESYSQQPINIEEKKVTDSDKKQHESKLETDIKEKRLNLSPNRKNKNELETELSEDTDTEPSKDTTQKNLSVSGSTEAENKLENESSEVTIDSQEPTNMKEKKLTELAKNKHKNKLETGCVEDTIVFEQPIGITQKIVSPNKKNEDNQENEWSEEIDLEQPINIKEKKRTELAKKKHKSQIGTLEPIDDKEKRLSLSPSKKNKNQLETEWSEVTIDSEKPTNIEEKKQTESAKKKNRNELETECVEDIIVSEQPISIKRKSVSPNTKNENKQEKEWGEEINAKQPINIKEKKLTESTKKKHKSLLETELSEDMVKSGKPIDVKEKRLSLSPNKKNKNKLETEWSEVTIDSEEPTNIEEKKLTESAKKKNRNELETEWVEDIIVSKQTISIKQKSVSPNKKNEIKQENEWSEEVNAKQPINIKEKKLTESAEKQQESQLLSEDTMKSEKEKRLNVTPNKKNKNALETEWSELTFYSEEPKNIEKEKLTESAKKKQKNKLETEWVENTLVSKQTPSKKNDNKLETEWSQMTTDSEQPINIKEKKLTELAKKKHKTQLLPEDTMKSEQPIDVKEKRLNATPNKKNKNKLETEWSEVTIASEQPTNIEEKKLTESAKKKHKNKPETEWSEDIIDLEQPQDIKEKRVSKKNKNKPETEWSEVTTDSEQPINTKEKKLTESAKKKPKNKLGTEETIDYKKTMGTKQKKLSISPYKKSKLDIDSEQSKDTKQKKLNVSLSKHETELSTESIDSEELTPNKTPLAGLMKKEKTDLKQEEFKFKSPKVNKVSTSSIEENFVINTCLARKLDKFLEQKMIDFEKNSINDESNDSTDESNSFIDDMAEEGEEDTPSDDSNELIDEGESIHSDTDRSEDSGSESQDSFVCDDDEECFELLSGDEYDLGDEKKKKRTRIIDIEDMDDDKIIINKKPKVEQKKKKSRIIVNESSSDDDDDVFKNKEIPRSIEDVDVKEIKDPVLNTTPRSSSINIIQNVDVIEGKDESVRTTPRNRKSSINIIENVDVKEIKDAALSTRINKLINTFCNNIPSNGGVAMNLSLEYDESAEKTSLKRPLNVEDTSSKKIKMTDKPQQQEPSTSSTVDPKPTKKSKKQKRLVTKVNKEKQIKRQNSPKDVLKNTTFGLMNQLITDVKNRPRRNIQPSLTIEDINTSWIIEDTGNIKPSTTIFPDDKNQRFIKKKTHTKDFRTKMLYESSRIKRIGVKDLLRKKGAYY